MANGRVTLKEVYELVDERYEKLSNKLDSKTEAIEKAVNSHSIEIGQIKQTQTAITVFQMVLTTIASSIAAYLGIKR
jgi:hypothetical protein